MKARISMITLGVTDLARSIEFYENGMGLPRLDLPPSVAFFNLNGSWLGLYGHDALAEDAGVAAEGGGFRGCTLSYNVAEESQVEAIINEAIAAGATVVKTPQRAAWGGYHAYFQDPDGHLWEVAYNPFGWVGPEDKD